MIPETLSIDGASELFVFEMDIFLFIYLYGIIVGIIHLLKNLHTFDERIPNLNDRETDRREMLQPLFGKGLSNCCHCIESQVTPGSAYTKSRSTASHVALTTHIT